MMSCQLCIPVCICDALQNWGGTFGGDGMYMCEEGDHSKSKLLINELSIYVYLYSISMYLDKDI